MFKNQYQFFSSFLILLSILFINCLIISCGSPKNDQLKPLSPGGSPSTTSVNSPTNSITYVDSQSSQNGPVFQYETNKNVQIMPKFTGGMPTSYSEQPDGALESLGLILKPNGAIVVDPTKKLQTGVATIIISAQNQFNSSPVQTSPLTITIIPAPLNPVTGISYPGGQASGSGSSMVTSFSFYQDTNISPSLTPKTTGGTPAPTASAPTAYSLADGNTNALALLGLNFNTSTGVISAKDTSAKLITGTANIIVYTQNSDNNSSASVSTNLSITISTSPFSVQFSNLIQSPLFHDTVPLVLFVTPNKVGVTPASLNLILNKKGSINDFHLNSSPIPIMINQGSYSFDTTKFEDGFYTINVQIIDNNKIIYTNVETLNLQIKNKWTQSPFQLSAYGYTDGVQSFAGGAQPVIINNSITDTKTVLVGLAIMHGGTWYSSGSTGNIDRIQPIWGSTYSTNTYTDINSFYGDCNSGASSCPDPITDRSGAGNIKSLTLQCPMGSAVVGFKGNIYNKGSTTSTWLNSLGLICNNIYDSSPTGDVNVTTSANNDFPFNGRTDSTTNICPNNTFVTTIKGYESTYVDQIYGSCN